jgi:hypothetical protein
MTYDDWKTTPPEDQHPEPPEEQEPEEETFEIRKDPSRGEGGQWIILLNGFKLVRAVRTKKAAQEYVKLAEKHGWEALYSQCLLLDGCYQ